MVERFAPTPAQIVEQLGDARCCSVGSGKRSITVSTSS
jgi:hypothetical protein